MTSPSAQDLVLDFFVKLTRGDVDEAFIDAADDIVFKNVGAPTVRGKRRVQAVMRRLNGGFIHFDADLLTIAATDDGVVLMERWDEVRVGPLRMQLLVCGHNEVRDGQITVWRDTHDYLSGFGALLKGLAALVFPRLLPPLKNPMSSYRLSTD